MARRLDCPTCLNPSTSVQNLCDSAMSRTLITRWLMPPGVTASVGASGTIGKVPSAIIWLLRSSFLGNYMGAPSALPIAPAGSPVEPAPGEAEQPLRHEDHHRDEHQADRDQIVFRQEAGQRLAQQEIKGRADSRPDQGADAADDVEDDDLARDQEEHEIGSGEAVLHGVEHPGE